MPDLRIGANVSDELLLEEWDLWKTGDMETAFFADDSLTAGVDKKGKKKRKKDRNPKWFRKTAYVEAKALDGILRNRMGAGLEQFCDAAVLGPGAPPPPTWSSTWTMLPAM